ncbi:MAG: hypothetical protein KDC12_07650 [Flavobacteriales bacterium]|nr:hypothetical protein [Flavobacteriales bacterium]
MRNTILGKATLLILGLVCLLGLASPAQDKAPQVPDALVLNVAEDYAQYQGLVVKCLSWLVSTPSDVQIPEREELNAFVILWLSGAPDITVDVTTDCMPFLKDHEDLFFTFLHGMALFQIKHPAENDPARLHEAGLEAVVFQVKETKCKRTPELKEILKAERKGRLYEYAVECSGAKSK